MARDTGGRTARAVATEAERAALDLLRERTALVGAASAAQHERNQVVGALDKADAAYADAYAAAIAGGWTADELARLGLQAPHGDATRRRRQTRPAPAPASTPAPPVSSPPGGHEAAGNAA